MDSSTQSVSKGVFLFSNGFPKSKNVKKKQTSLLFDNFFTKEPWYVVFKKNWDFIEEEIKDLNQKTYSTLQNDMVNYIKSFYDGNESLIMDGVIPSATLLTGVNQPDHLSQFMTLIDKIREEVSPHIAMISSQDAPTLKHIIENVVYQLIYGFNLIDEYEADVESNIQNNKKLRKNQCTMKQLSNWYQNLYQSSSPKKKKHVNVNKSLVIIIPDFECFNTSVLQDFVMIISAYISSLPIVLVFGVATSVSALHKSFPYHVSSKLLIKVFHSHSSPVYMNKVLEEIFLTPKSSFHISGKAFELLTDVFLFYDFSVSGLIQSIKYCMMEHYYGENIKSLCCEKEEIEEAVSKLTAEELENIRQLPSFRPFLEAQVCEMKIALFQDDHCFRQVLIEEMFRLHDYINTFYVSIRLLVAFVKDLPRNLLGKTVREVYTRCAVEHITNTPTFKECMQLVKFQSQAKLVDSVKNALKVVNTAMQMCSPVKPLKSSPLKQNTNMVLGDELGENFLKKLRVHLIIFLKQIENAKTETIAVPKLDMDDEADIENSPGNRYKLKEKLLKATKVERVQSEFEMVRSRFVSYIEEVFIKGLRPPHTQTFNEIFFFSDASNVKKQIIGAPRGALHTALSNPSHYLQCKCCQLTSVESITDTLPDLSIVYKLHRECGKHINLYDWLQAFGTVVQPSDEEQKDVDENMQMRFTRAVAELQFLGFIKTSKRKTDHVIRLTW